MGAIVRQKGGRKTEETIRCLAVGYDPVDAVFALFVSVLFDDNRMGLGLAAIKGGDSACGAATKTSEFGKDGSAEGGEDSMAEDKDELFALTRLFRAREVRLSGGVGEWRVESGERRVERGEWREKEVKKEEAMSRTEGFLFLRQLRRCFCHRTKLSPLACHHRRCRFHSTQFTIMHMKERPRFQAASPSAGALA